MLELHHIALFFAALASAKYGLIDRRAPITTIFASMLFFAAFSISSFFIQVPVQGQTDYFTTLPGMFAVGLGGTLFMLAMGILEALDKLPDESVRGVLADAEKKAERGEGLDDSRDFSGGD